MRRSAQLAKRTLDIVGSAAGLLLCLPLLPLAALAIKLDSPGPVFFRQRRVGIDRRAVSTSGGDERRRVDLGGAVFRMIKFRTMRADAEKIAGPSWTSDHDPRITRVGALLRATKIDELPQLWNVLRGEMSLVGPRPETPHFVEKLTHELPVYRERVAGVKPGITGLAQIHCEDDGSFFGSLREKIYYDLLYGARLARLRRWHDPIRLDLGIIFKTLHRLLNVRKKIDNDVIRIELPRRLEHLVLDPGELARNAPHGVRPEILDRNPDKITVWWYLPRRRSERPPEGEVLSLEVMRRLTDEMAYARNAGGKGANELRLVKYLDGRGRPSAPRAAPASRERPLASRNRRMVTDRIKLEAPSRVEHIPRVEELLEPIWRELGRRSADPHFAFNMSLLVLEALTNVMKHAHQGCPEERIPVEITISADRVRLTVMDYGQGFELDQVDAAPMEEWLSTMMRPLYAGATSTHDG